MSMELTPNTQAILLLTAPLVTGRGKPASNPLSIGEYKRLARLLREHQRQPAELVGPQADEILNGCQPYFDRARLEDLLGRGFLLSQAVERWQARAIWVISRADVDYPKRLKKRLREDAPPVLYGCGDPAILDTGGLAVVGSRNVDEALIGYTEGIGRVVANAQRTLVSGGARGVDQAAMRGALEAGGQAVGVLADTLERAALARENRDVLMNRQLVLISPYDPAAGFNVGHAMQRNKLIYALADAALVVSSDYEKGGTWAGAVEQLDKLRFVNVYVRSRGEIGKGLEALQRKGALPWPNPEIPEALGEVLDSPMDAAMDAPGQEALPLQLMEVREEPASYSSAESSDEQQAMEVESAEPKHGLPAEELFAKVRELVGRMETPKTDTEVAEDLKVSKAQAREWLDRLVEEGVLVRLSKPTRYCSSCSSRLF
jgi:DNA processing protein